MSEDLPKQARAVWVALTIVVSICIVGVFLTFAPVNTRAVYWIAMVDLVLMSSIGLLTSIFTVDNSGQSRKGLSTAMQIAISSTLGIVFLFGFVFDLVFLFVLYAKSMDNIFIWIAIGKWVLPCFLVVPMWFVDKSQSDDPAPWSKRLK